MSFSVEGPALGPPVHPGCWSICPFFDGCFTVQVLLSKFAQLLQNGLEKSLC